MIISIDTEETFEKIQQLFMIETLSNPEIEGSFLNLIKCICGKNTAEIIFNS